MYYDIQEALNEIMDMPPMFRREYISDHIRKNLPKDEAKKVYNTRNKLRYCKKMMDEGYLCGPEMLEKIGKERVLQFFHILSNRS